ncbi:t-SNARE [Sistotremastrum niveocremeum HHB9708]|uniref:t-SNARE n=2 Tax=Sistotremastraceae TaxID=3402574 RepID=A0A165AIF9_9AGAM|nr:t-SNARE [Sistotremastrum niveocremeum HHB9708]KZT44067.1 t-SNARE [Sistotremastrum suecicum HHB10207 ss-3]
MARDRLAAMRAARGTPAGSGLEMGQVAEPSTPALMNGGDPMTAFYDEISSIQDAVEELNRNVSRISDLQSNSLRSLDDTVSQQDANQLDSLTENTRSLTANIKGRIQGLEAKARSTPGTNARIMQDQTGAVKAKFVEAIKNYQKTEQQYRTRYRQQMERQFKIVKPDATPEEVAAVVESQRGDQIFEQALLDSNRYGESRAAYREVQHRHEDIQKIERTLEELGQLFLDMAILVDQADDPINVMETQAADVEKNMESGLRQTEKATDSARRARRGRIICFWICVLIAIVIALAVGLPIGLKAANKNSS